MSQMTYEQAKRSIHVRSGMYREAKPKLIYHKNHPVPLDERVPPEDQLENDWREYDPREDPGNSQYDEMPA